jgi:hypothetical protein
MQILGTDAYRNALESNISNSNESVFIVSAYITIEGIDWILSRLPISVNCNVLTRWACSDLVSGASDIEVYNRLKRRGYDLYILPDLHAKVTLIDKSTLFLGSANITNSGLKLVPGGNREIGTILKPTDQDISLINTLFSEGVLITEALYQIFLKELSQIPKEKNKFIPNWSNSLLVQLRKPPLKLWVAEMLWCSSPEEILNNSKTFDAIHDISLLGIDLTSVNTPDEIILRHKFIESRCWRWFENILQNSPNNEIYYGELSAKLHNSFLDDPTPYRQTVKKLLSNVLNWVLLLCNDLIIIDRPHHSQRIKLNS